MRYRADNWYAARYISIIQEQMIFRKLTSNHLKVVEMILESKNLLRYVMMHVTFLGIENFSQFIASNNPKMYVDARQIANFNAKINQNRFGVYTLSPKFLSILLFSFDFFRNIAKNKNILQQLKEK